MEEEPYKTAAFQIILYQLLSQSSEPHHLEQLTTNKSLDSKDEKIQNSDSKTVHISIPDTNLEYILNLKDPEKILTVWSYSNEEWMGLAQFLNASKEIGITYGKSWSHGGNFNNRLYGEKQLFVKRGHGKDAEYKLSAKGRIFSKEILEKQGKEAEAPADS